MNSLQGKVDTIGQRYDAAQQQLTAAKGRLAQISRQYDRAEAQYKAVARALRTAVEIDPRVQGVPSTKGVL